MDLIRSLSSRELTRSEKGFTLIELLAVIVILGIVLAIAIPSVEGSIDRSLSR